MATNACHCMQWKCRQLQAAQHHQLRSSCPRKSLAGRRLVQDRVSTVEKAADQISKSKLPSMSTVNTRTTTSSRGRISIPGVGRESKHAHPPRFRAYIVGPRGRS